MKILPKCNIHTVHILPTGEDEYFVDGYQYGGYKDFRVKYDKTERSLTFSSDDTEFTALRTR
jgi:hypothetical protein